MADITALSQLLDASLDPRRNKEGKSLLFTHTYRPQCNTFDAPTVPFSQRSFSFQG
jgi:hypothetical protein